MLGEVSVDCLAPVSTLWSSEVWELIHNLLVYDLGSRFSLGHVSQCHDD